MKIRDDHSKQDLAALTRLLHDLTADMPPQRQQRLKDHLITELRQAEPHRSLASARPRGTEPRGRRRRPYRLLVGASAAAVGAATAVTAIGITSQGGQPLPPATKAAVQLLAKVADAAAHQPAPRVRDGQYMYVETKVAMPFLPTRTVHTAQPLKRGSLPRNLHLKWLITSQNWAPVANVCRTGLGRTILPNGHGWSEKFSAQGPYNTCPSIGGLNDPTYRLLQRLPTGPHGLLAMIYRVERGHGPGPGQEAFVTIGDLLRGTIPPPKVAAALYRAVALIPGVTVVRDATDAIGRHGVAIAQTTGPVRSELIFSRTTLRLIGERTVITSTGASTGATAIISQGFADHPGQLPHTAQTP